MFRAEGSEIDLESSVGALLDLRAKPRAGRRPSSESESQVGLGQMAKRASRCHANEG
jgi:hypothetical protein